MDFISIFGSIDIELDHLRILMSSLDFSKYTSVEQVIKDIKEIKIQGATNVALATFEGLKLFLSQYPSDKPYHEFLLDLEKTGYILANARPNEPLAKNGVKFVMNMIRIKHPGMDDTATAISKVDELVAEYLLFIQQAKDKIVENSTAILGGVDEVVTHCHSSTAEKIIINQSKRIDNFSAVCTETRPLFQGRITAKNLLDAGVDTTMIADSAVESFIIGRGVRNTDVVFIGCDEITIQGDTINKIGSWGVALAAYYASKPIYVVGSILKTDISTAYRPIEIEMRDARELWQDAPEGLKMVNPAFELVNRQLITGYITEIGILKPEEIQGAIQKEYQWLF
ncbi:hypothetical protein H6762_02345 [Candidatus Nomurabacteria bacterium]|uniref:Translation initiation factor eIF-2B n=1 Tax=Candidatus Dojkabacteria bacterium TaxID=2099670 RepID=A0A955KX23_9BACT|nr:hypothetical protein [Candidatus Dojkabacteria bacterium]MCB9789801.1 hypothetical protein [Candidatus Nomurabacteria bacterium]